MPQSVFSRPFGNHNTVNETNTHSRFGRTQGVIPGTKIDDVLQHYVKNAHQVTSQVQQSGNGSPIPGHGALDANLMKTINDRRDIKNILEMNPNAQLAIDICVNGTLSPNNTLDSQLQYKSTYDKLGPLKSTFLQKIRDFMNEYVEFEDLLPTILREAKYEVGSYAILTIPTGQIKSLINAEKIKGDSGKRVMKFESMVNDLSMGKSKASRSATRALKHQVLNIKLEDVGFTAAEKEKHGDVGSFNVHGDYEVLRLRHIRDRIAKRSDMDDCLDGLDGLSSYDPAADLESLKQESLSGDIISESLQRAKNFSVDDVIELSPEIDFEGTDIAQYEKIPHESMYILHKPGDPKAHEYYFIALDMSGYPISIDGELDLYMPNYSGIYGNDATNSAMASQTNFSAGNLELGYNGYTDQTMYNRRVAEKAALFTKIMEDRLVKSIKDGEYKTKDISLTEHSDLMKAMFNRFLANKQTQLLLVPASLMTYYAFDYDDNGNGQSLVLKHKNIGVFNSILTLANTISAINNTIDYKEVKIRFDDDELDFSKTNDMIVGNLARNSTMNGFRLLSTDVNRQIDFIGMKGYQLAYEDHPQFPGTSVEINNLDRERTAPDPDVIEKNESLLIQGLGSTPEVVDMARNVEFASSYFQTNLQAARRAIADQKIMCKDNNKFVRTFAINSPALLKWMIKEIDKSRGKNPELRGIKTTVIVKDFINSVTTHLPKPDMVKVELLDKAITAQETLVEHMLKYTIGEEALRNEDVGDNLEGALAALRAKVKSLIMRDFLASNNMLGDGFITALYNGDREEVDSTMSRLETNQEFILSVLKEHEVITSQLIATANEEVANTLEARDIGDGSGGGTTSSTEPADSSFTADAGAEGGDPNEVDGGTPDPDEGSGGQDPENPFG